MRRYGRFWGAVLIVLVLSVLIWWWRTPDVFGGEGTTISIRNDVGTVALVGVLVVPQDVDDATVTVHSVEPRISAGSDTATVEVLACDGAFGAGRGWESLDQYCLSHGDAVGAELSQGDHLVVAVSSDEPQQVVVEGVEVTYSYGWQRGTQVTGATADVTFAAQG